MISIYCSERLDGIASAAIVLRHALLAKLPAQFGGVLHPDRLEEELEALAQVQGKLIFMLDISFTPGQLTSLEGLQGKNKLVYWTSNDVQSAVPPARLVDSAQGTECCAHATQRRFLPTDLIARQLAEIAHGVKFWEEDTRGRKIEELIAAGYPLQELIEQLSKGVFWNDRFEAFYHKYEDKKQDACEEMMNSLILKKYVNTNLGFVLCPLPLATAQAGEYVLKSHAGVDVAVVLYRDGRFTLRRKDSCKADMRELAVIFGGGGTIHASGGRIADFVTKDNLPEVLFHLDQAFKEYFITNSAQ